MRTSRIEVVVDHDCVASCIDQYKPRYTKKWREYILCYRSCVKIVFSDNPPGWKDA